MQSATQGFRLFLGFVSTALYFDIHFVALECGNQMSRDIEPSEWMSKCRATETISRIAIKIRLNIYLTFKRLQYKLNIFLNITFGVYTFKKRQSSFPQNCFFTMSKCGARFPSVSASLVFDHFSTG